MALPADSWCRWFEGPVEEKWCWCRLQFTPGRWCYGIDRAYNRVALKVFLWAVPE